MPTTDRHADVAIIGAGPAGSAAAIELGRAGKRVILIEKQRFPRDKVCGGCLSATARMHLQRLLGRDRQLPGVPERQITFVVGSYRLTFKPNGITRMVPRAELDTCLADTAARAGVDVLYDHKATLEAADGAWRVHDGRGGISADRILVAAGAAGVPRTLGIERRPSKRALIGQQWFQPAAAPLPSLGNVEMHWLKGGYAGLATPEAHRCVVAIAVEAPLGAHRSPFDKLRKLNPQASIWEILPPDAATRHDATGIAGFPWLPRRLGRENVLLIGDAAGFEEPYSGEGIGLAMLSAACSVRAVLAGGDILQNYTQLMRRHRRVMWRTRMISRLLRTSFVGSLAASRSLLPEKLLSRAIGHIHAKGCL